MQANPIASRISFLRFVGALLRLLFCGNSGPVGLPRSASTGNKAAVLNAAPAIFFTVALWLLAAPFSYAQTAQITPTVMPLSSLQNVLLLDVNVGPNDNFDPHVDGVWVSYTSDDGTGDYVLRYHNLASGFDAAIPQPTGVADFLSDVNQGRIVFTRIGSSGGSTIMLFDIASGTLTEIDPQPGVIIHRGFPRIAGNTIAYEDETPPFTDVIQAYDLTTGITTLLSNNSDLNANPKVSPDGNTVVWQRCVSNFVNCDIWQAVNSGGSWTVSAASTDPSLEENPDTNGLLIVYDSDRPTGAGDLFYRAIGSSAEAQVLIPGVQYDPRISGNFVATQQQDPTGSVATQVLLYDISQNELFDITNDLSKNIILHAISVLPSGEMIVVFEWDGSGDTRGRIQALVFTPQPSTAAPYMPGAATHVLPIPGSSSTDISVPPLAVPAGGLQFLCSLDRNPFRPCVSPAIYTGLPVGPHILAVEAVDINHNVSVPAISYFTITSSAPTTPLTITPNNAAQVYGGATPSFGVSYSGFVNGDTPASLAGTLVCMTPANQTSPVGTYPILCSGLSSSTYAITFAPGTLAITPAPLTVAANSAARPYGAGNPVLTGIITGLQNGDPITASFSTTAGPASFVGSYPIVPSLYDPSNRLANYSLSLVNGTLAVTPETTIVTAVSSPASIPVGLSATVTVTLTAPDMVIPIDPSALGPLTLTSPVVSDIFTNNGLCIPVPTAAPGVATCTFTVTAVEPNGRTLNASFLGTANLLGSNGTADLIATAALESQQTCLNADFLNVGIPGGSYVWFNSIFKVRDVPRRKVTLTFFQSSVQFHYKDATKNVVTVTLAMPDARIVIDPTVTTPSTTFDSVDSVWLTTIPFDLDDSTFLTGIPWLVPAGGLPGDIEPVSWCGTFASDAGSVDIGWRWAAAAYSSFSGDSSTLGVKPMDSDWDNPSNNHDPAGTPENFKQFVIPGARGRGGRNFTGTYSRSALIE